MSGIGDKMDAGFEPPPDWSPDSIEAQELPRLMADAMMALAAVGHPRRLGGDASREELARDKRISRKIANAYLVVLRFYGAGRGDWRELIKRAAQDDEARVAGAQVRWVDWVPERLRWLEQRIGRVAAYALKRDEMTWGNHAVFRLERERELLDLAARELLR